MYDDAVDFSALLRVFMRDANGTTQANAVRAPLIGLRNPDPALGYPPGTLLQPWIFLRNAGPAPLAPALSLNWHSPAASGSTQVPLATLVPGESRIVDLTALQQSGSVPANAMWATATLTYNGLRNDLIAVAASYDATGRYGLQSPFSDNLSFMWKGGMWHVDGEHETLITTGNAGSKPANVAVKLFYPPNGVYVLPEKVLAPGEQILLQVGQLIRNKVPDKNGNLLPLDAMEGSYEVQNLSDQDIGYLYEGKLIVDTTYGHATYGCAGCCGYDNSELLADPMNGLTHDSGTLVPWAYNTCTSAWVQKIAGSWASTNSAVASVNSSGVVSLLSPGTATISSSEKLLEANDGTFCSMQFFPQSSPVNVVMLSCTTSVTRGGTATCTVTPSTANVTGWNFKDSSSNTVTRTSNQTSLTWSGVMVTSGTVNVTANGVPLSAAITVNNRANFAFTPVSPSQLTGNTLTCYNGTSETLQSPPTSTSALGVSCPDLAFNEKDTPIADNGPNNGYQYVTSVSSTFGQPPTQQPTKYVYIFVSDLLSTTTFYNTQCGTYSSSNSLGYIAGSQLQQNALDHEQGSVLSHWTEYRDAQNNSSNNVGTLLESIVGAPGTSQATYENQLGNTANNAINNILSAVAVEPCGGSPNDDSSQSCAYCGGLNYSPYQSCGNSQPVPYCH